MDLHRKKIAVVSPELSREDIKESFFGTVFNIDGFLEYLKVECGIGGEFLQDKAAKVALLEEFLRSPELGQVIDPLTRFFDRDGFFREMERTFSEGRSMFVTWSEYQVQDSILLEKLGPRHARRTMAHCARAYEAYLESLEIWDRPSLIRKLITVAESGRGPALPEIIRYRFSPDLPLEEALWNVLQNLTSISDHSFEKKEYDPYETGKLFHSVDQAARFLANTVNANERPTILIPDEPAIRRVLMRELKVKNIEILNLRDPLENISSEVMRVLIGPLVCIARNYQKEDVLSWLISLRKWKAYPDEEMADSIKCVSALGYLKGRLQIGGAIRGELSRKLEILHSRCEKEMDASQLRQCLLEFWKLEMRVMPKLGVLSSWLQVAEKNEGDKKKRADEWLRYLRFEMWGASPSAPSLEPQGSGVYVHAVSHFQPQAQHGALYFFAIPEDYLDEESIRFSSIWYSGEERELLAREFPVPTRENLVKARKLVLESWSASRSVSHWHCQFGPRGENLWTQSAESLNLIPLSEEEAAGYGPWSPAKRSWRLPRRAAVETMSVSALDNYSKCPNLALARNFWKLEDITQARFDLSPKDRGIVQHECVAELMRGGEQGGAQKVFERLESDRAAGKLSWIGTPRMKAVEFRRLEQVLERFLEKEREAQEKSPSSPISLDEESLVWEVTLESGEKLQIRGRPDRVDQTNWGLKIVDYKSSLGQVPHGQELLEKGAGLQMAVYALSLRKKTGRDIVGLQYVELNKTGSRSKGLFFPEYNGKEKKSGKYLATHARRDSKSLSAMGSEESLKILENWVREKSELLMKGEFEPAPFKEEICLRCSARTVCGKSRSQASGEEP